MEGPKIVQEALAAKGQVVRKIYALKEWLVLKPNYAKVRTAKLWLNLSWKKISAQNPNQVLAVVEMPRLDFRFRTDQPGLVLDGIQDPGNLGTIIRIADWFGVQQIICSKDCADAYNSKVVQSTMGSIFRVQLLYTDLNEWLDQQQEQPFMAQPLMVLL
ncbi:hypothetical protein LWM68_34255 [Niabella sp. W65]|nr:hypothetical protein [Niabella sp. W65]MCH7367379.1 hypothetical protein [Niabella sp. W65]